MFSQSYDDEAPLPLIANYTVVKEHEPDPKPEDRVILEIGKPDDKPKDNTFSHKKYDKTISHHRSYVLDDYEPQPIFRPHELEEPRYYNQEFRESQENSESSMEYGHEQQEGSGKLVVDETSQPDGVISWKDRALQLEKGM